MGSSFHVNHKPRVKPILEIIEETPKIKSFYLKAPDIATNSDPGQFIMVWIVGTDEIPMAVSATEEDGKIGFTVEKVGDATSKLHEHQKGDPVGIRGPYGNSFDLSGDNLLIVGGGCGMSPLALTAEEALEQGKEITVVLSAKTAEDLLFKSRLEKLDLDLFLGTEDGSEGIKGVTTDVLEKIGSIEKFDNSLVCGPEKMMVATAEFLEKKEIPIQVSLNRYMKCGVGLCGSCSLDPTGLRVCIEGPVFDYKEVKDGEFGEYKRDSAGRKTEI